jgi:hypothetical protein
MLEGIHWPKLLESTPLKIIIIIFIFIFETILFIILRSAPFPFFLQ